VYLGLLDAETRSRGLSLVSEGVNEVGWQKADALRVVSVAADAGLPILGGDIWQTDAGHRWRPTGDNWVSDRRSREDKTAYVERSRAEAIAYLNRYPDPGDGTTRYVVVCGKP